MKGRQGPMNEGNHMPGDMSWMKDRFDELDEKSLLWEPPTLQGANMVFIAAGMITIAPARK